MPAQYGVDGYGVLLGLLRPELPDWHVLSRIPDGIPGYLNDGKSLLVIRRTGGGIQEGQQRFTERWLFSFQTWFQPDLDAIELGFPITKILFEAAQNQTVTEFGHINTCRAAVGWQDITDAGLIQYGRGISSFDFTLRSSALV